MIQVDRLILLSGPSGAGKSTFMRRLQGRQLTELSDQLQLGDPSEWWYATTRDLQKLPECRVHKMIVHYDFLRPWKYNLRQGYEGDERLAVLKNCNDMVFVTLWAVPETLLLRTLSRKRRLLLKLFRLSKFGPRLRRLLALRKTEALYRSSRAVVLQYQKWFEFCARYRANAHWIVDASGDVVRIFPLAEWARENEVEVEKEHERSRSCA